jgi:hypothetical protein
LRRYASSCYAWPIAGTYAKVQVLPYLGPSSIDLAHCKGLTIPPDGFLALGFIGADLALNLLT